MGTSVTSLPFIYPPKPFGWRLWRGIIAISPAKLDRLGLVTMLLFFWASLVPSLLPRPWYLQITISSTVSVIGYGIGSLLAAAFRLAFHHHRWPQSLASKTLLHVVATWSAALMCYQLIANAVWQYEMYRLIGLAPPRSLWFTATVVVLIGTICGTWAGVVFCTLNIRLLRWLAAWLSHRRWVAALPKSFERAVATAFSLTVLIIAANGFNIRILNTLINLQYRAQNQLSPAGLSPPTAPNVSGGNGSLVAWDKLGLHGREFVSDTPDASTISATSGRSAKDPIRIYVGLEQSSDPDYQARIAVKELERTHAFDRKYMLLIIATGTGWIDQASTGALEYLTDGDIASVAIQYSYLPSWISFLRDKQLVSDAAQESIGHTISAIDNLPAERRPKVYLFAESLGSFGAETALLSDKRYMEHIDGVLLVGPPGFNPWHQELVARRDPSSPSYKPRIADGHKTLFVTGSGQFSQAGPAPKLIYLQNPTDPVTKWNTDLLWSKPAWLDEEKRDGLLASHFDWVPIVTFFQVSADMVLAEHMPAGTGHNYGTEALHAWETMTGIGADHAHEQAIDSHVSE